MQVSHLPQVVKKVVHLFSFQDFELLRGSKNQVSPSSLVVLNVCDQDLCQKLVNRN